MEVKQINLESSLKNILVNIHANLKFNSNSLKCLENCLNKLTLQIIQNLQDKKFGKNEMVTVHDIENILKKKCPKMDNIQRHIHAQGMNAVLMYGIGLIPYIPQLGDIDAVTDVRDRSSKISSELLRGTKSFIRENFINITTESKLAETAAIYIEKLLKALATTTQKVIGKDGVISIAVIKECLKLIFEPVMAMHARSEGMKAVAIAEYFEDSSAESDIEEKEIRTRIQSREKSASLKQTLKNLRNQKQETKQITATKTVKTGVKRKIAPLKKSETKTKKTCKVVRKSKPTAPKVKSKRVSKKKTNTKLSSPRKTRKTTTNRKKTVSKSKRQTTSTKQKTKPNKRSTNATSKTKDKVSKIPKKKQKTEISKKILPAIEIFGYHLISCMENMEIMIENKDSFEWICQHLKDIADQIVFEMLLKAEGSTIKYNAVVKAVEQLLPKNMAQHAITEGLRALSCFVDNLH